MLTRAHRQEALSRAYVHAVAAHCGFACSGRELDYGIDLTVYGIRRVGSRYSESGVTLDIQAKSATGATLTGSHVLYDMEVKAYDDLRDPAVLRPRLLVLLVLPDDEVAWTEHTEDHLLLRRCAYWMSVRGMPATANVTTVRVAIPRTNLFSPDGLRRLMTLIAKQEAL